MTSPSSTSSSSRRRWPRGLAVAVALLAVVEIGGARQTWLWAYVPDSQTGIIDALESQVIAPAPPPLVVLMGSSRMRDAVAPRVLEVELGLPAGAVLNLGVTAGTPFDALTLYRRNREKLGRARAVVVGIEDWHFNAGLDPNERDRRYMSWSERWHGFRGEATLSLAAGWIWRTYDAQGPLRRLARALVRGRDAALPIAPDGRVRWRKIERDEGPETTDVAAQIERTYRRFTPGRLRVDALERLISLAREDGVRVFVVQLPWRDAYVDYAEAHHAAAFAAARRMAEGIEGADVVLYDRASALGIPARHFYDYGHLTPPGARVMTRRLAEVIAPAVRGVRSGGGAAIAPGPPG